MSRFYVPPENVDIRRSRVTVTGDEAHHIIDVMRMKERDKVTVFDGTGNEYSGFIDRIDAKSMKVVVEVIKTTKPAPGKFPHVTLVQAIPKQDKMDMIVEKATELGVSKIIPVVTDRTIVRPDKDGRVRKADRWSKIAMAAAKQCGRTDVPEVSKPQLFESIPPMLEDFDLALVAHLCEDTMPISSAFEGFNSGKLLVAIGPEGDFTFVEVEQLRRENVRHISLGPRVLRSDTAAIFVLSSINYEFMK